MMAFFIMSCEDKIEEEILNETIKPQLQVTLSQDDEDLSLVKIKVELYDNNSSSCYIDSITIKYGTSPSNLTSTLTNGDNIYSSSYNEYEFYFDENGTYYFKVVAFCHYSHSGYYDHNGCYFMSNFTLESEVESITVANVPANEGAVDLGLSVKWAACNLGSTKPYEQGILSVWGNPSIYFNADFDGDTTIAIEDCGGVNPPLCISGTELDIATTQLGGDWRLPTKAEAQELLDSCEWIYTRHHGTEGYIVTGPNGNSIFLPDKFIMTGCINSIYSYDSDYYNYYRFYNGRYLETCERNRLSYIRPVQGEIIDTTTSPITTLDETFNNISYFNQINWKTAKMKSDKNRPWNIENDCAVISNEGTAPFDEWLISPPINISGTRNKILTFETRGYRYNQDGANTSSLEVYVLTSDDPTKATMTKLDATIYNIQEVDYSYSIWAPSGYIDLSKFSGIIYIGFRYKSDESTMSTKYYLDNIKLISESDLLSYKKVTSITPGKSYLIVADGKAATALNHNSEYLDVVSVTETDDTIKLLSNSCEFTFIKVTGGYFIMDVNGKYYYCYSDNFYISNHPYNNGSIWSVNQRSDDTMIVSNNSTNLYIQYNESSNYFRLYSSRQGILPTLYERID